MSQTLRILTTLLLVPAFACDSPTGPFIGDDGVGEIVVEFGARPGDWPLDPYIIDAARVSGDTLMLRIDHGGGCRNHAYALLAWDGWLESEPVQVQAVLAHEDRDDPCDGVVRSHLRFDLTPLRDAWAEAYGPEGRILIRLSNPAGPAGPPLRTILYEF